MSLGLNPGPQISPANTVLYTSTTQRGPVVARVPRERTDVVGGGGGTHVVITEAWLTQNLQRRPAAADSGKGWYSSPKAVCWQNPLFLGAGQSLFFIADLTASVLLSPLNSPDLIPWDSGTCPILGPQGVETPAVFHPPPEQMLLWDGKTPEL